MKVSPFRDLPLILPKNQPSFLLVSKNIITFACDYHGVLRIRLRLYPLNLTQIMLSQGIDISLS